MVVDLLPYTCKNFRVCNAISDIAEHNAVVNSSRLKWSYIILIMQEPSKNSLILELIIMILLVPDFSCSIFPGPNSCKYFIIWTWSVK